MKDDDMASVRFKEGAGVLTAFLVVLSYVGIGFVQTAAVVVLGAEVKMPPDWMAAMLSLASAALGFLIGKQSGPDAAPTAAPQQPLAPLATVAPAKAETPLPSRPVAGNVPR